MENDSKTSMNISEKKLVEFIELFRKKTGSTLPSDKALVKANALLRTIQLLYKPIRKSDYNALHSDSLLLPYKNGKMKKKKNY